MVIVNFQIAIYIAGTVYVQDMAIGVLTFTKTSFTIVKLCISEMLLYSSNMLLSK